VPRLAGPDQRKTLAARVVAEATGVVEAELLRRLALKPKVGTCIVDTALRDVMAPFNEHTASPAAVQLPRGSRVAVPASKRSE
jgi:hypothetical protein